MKILAAVDGSARSQAALESLVSHLDWFRQGAELTLVHVHLPLPYQRAVAWAGKEAVHQYYEEESEEALAGARRLLDSRAVPYAVEKRVGEPAQEIAECAKTGRYDLIVMGPHGHTALGNLVLGSVTTKVLAICALPVLLL